MFIDQACAVTTALRFSKPFDIRVIGLCLLLAISAGVAKADPSHGATEAGRSQTVEVGMQPISSIRATLIDPYGNNPQYSIHVLSTGEALIDVEGSDAVWVRHHVARGHETFTRIANEITRSGFFKMKPRFVTKEDGCRIIHDGYWTLIITVVKTGVTKEVTLYGGCLGNASYMDIPEIWVLNGIDNLIKDKTGASKWVDSDD